MNNPKSRYKEQVLQLKHDAVLGAVNKLLAAKGYDHMTVDEVAEHAGMSKASLYKLYASKEDLAGAAMTRVLDLALNLVNEMRTETHSNALDKLKSLTRWAMATKLGGEMPSLPAQNSTLSDALQTNEAYMERLFELSMKLSIWIAQAQNEGLIKAQLPATFVLYNLYARACDPVLDVMKAEGQYSDEDIIEMLIAVHFDGMTGYKLSQIT